jgi:hypothetical protein
MERMLSLEDYLYLPSHFTINRKEEMIKKYGSLAVQSDREVSLCIVLSVLVRYNSGASYCVTWGFSIGDWP